MINYIQVDINSLKKTVLAELYPPELIKKDKKILINKHLRENSDNSTFGQRPLLTMAEVSLLYKL